MTVASVTATFSIPHALSLKDKRMVLRSILQKVQNKFNVSAAEVDAQDLHRTAVLGFAYVAANTAQADSIYESLARFLDSAALSQDAEITAIERVIH